MTATSPISHVSDTAHWVAVYRAMESERPDAIFHDPFARRLAGERGEAIVRNMRKGMAFAWPMIVRTAVIDEMILRGVGHDGVRTVANLAAGLDTRPYRLPLPRELRWVDVDLPAMQAYKREAMAAESPRCALEWAPADLANPMARRALFDRIASGPAPALVLSEGLLIYLEPEQVAALARDLHARDTITWWLIDIASPRLLKLMERTWGPALRAGGAPFKFAPAEGPAFFAPAGWQETEFRSMWDESLRLNRSIRFARFWSFLSRFYPAKTREAFRRMSGIVLMKRR